jgi:hypothetical protein
MLEVADKMRVVTTPLVDDRYHTSLEVAEKIRVVTT